MKRLQVNAGEITLLTADLVRAYRKKGELKISGWRGDARERAIHLAQGYLDIAEDHEGTRGELLAAFDDIPIAARERKVADGLRKLVLDRCEFEAKTNIDPIELRAALFQRAAIVRRESETADFDRDALMEEVGAQFELSSTQLEGLIFADLKRAHRLLVFRGCSAEDLLRQYEQGQVQAVLLRAEKVVVTLECDNPSTYRYFFRQLKFRRLLYRIEQLDVGYRITIDGPFSLFSSVTKYGLQLALLVPALRACDRWSLKADLRWGKDRAALKFQTDGSRADDKPTPALRDDVATLLDRMAKRAESAKSEWQAELADEIFNLPGVGVCIPDLVLTRNSDGVCVFVEVLGYWSRAAVWKRIELVEQGLDRPMVFVVPQRLRVSEDALPDDLPAALYAYKGVIVPKALEAAAASVANR